MSEYGPSGLAGILPPQANATVEAELGVLLPPGVATIVSRLTCYAGDSRARLEGYFHGIGEALRAFDTARPDVVLFACTGSSYLVGDAAERAAFAAQPVPVISAAGAVAAALAALGARKVAMVSPYPAWLTEASVAYWQSRGVEVLRVVSPEGDRTDTRRIYALGTTEAIAALGALDLAGADAVLLTGTGMPTLGAIAWHAARSRLPVVASNLCLAWAATQRLAGAALDADSYRAWIAPDAEWQARWAARHPASARLAS